MPAPLNPEIPEACSSSSSLHYDIDGDVQTAVPIRYSFNNQNQLQAVIPADANGGTDSDPFTFIGCIEIDDRHDLTYRLIDSEGNNLARTVIVYEDSRSVPALNVSRERFSQLLARRLA